MTILSREELKNLMEKRRGPCISIFLPTQRAGKEVEQNPIRFKNRLREAEERLQANGLRTPDVAAILEPAQKLLLDGHFWRNQSDGLAVFRAPDVFHYYRFPLQFEELTVVADRFHLKPMLPLLGGDARFYVLAISQDEVRLLQGTRYSVNRIDLKSAPGSLAEALRFDLPQKQLQFHSEAPPRVGKRDAVFFGTGAADPDVKNAILRYFQQVDRGLQDVLRHERAPLVLAGVDYLFPIYREANTYPHLLDGRIVGNPEEINAEELHRRALAIVQPYFQKSQYEAAAKCQELLGTGLASNNLQEIVTAAYYGRVESLFVAIGTQQWGTFDPSTNTVNWHEEAKPDNEDLLDFAAIHTLTSGGAVYPVAPEEVPDQSPIAAVFRY